MVAIPLPIGSLISILAFVLVAGFGLGYVTCRAVLASREGPDEDMGPGWLCRCGTWVDEAAGACVLCGATPGWLCRCGTWVDEPAGPCLRCGATAPREGGGFRVDWHAPDRGEMHR